jgi:WhiB family redox-sensing transcriptional regulator
MTTKIDFSWKRRAKCKGEDPALFFPNLDTSKYKDFAKIKKLCAACPVRVECLDYAVEFESDGYWGGMTANARLKLVEKRKHGIEA